MKRFFSTLLIAAALAAPLAAGSSTAACADSYPNVSTLTPFSLQANYMSLPGYLRFVVYQQNGVWLDRLEAANIVSNQIATGGE